MLRSTQFAAVAGVAVAATMLTPALASARPADPGVRVGVDNIIGAHAIHHASPVGSVGSVGQQAAKAKAFPSATSTVVGSVGFINDTEIGYFWSAARGDSVEQDISCPAHISKAALKMYIPENSLADGVELDWTLSVNGKDVGRFTMFGEPPDGISLAYKFPKMATHRSCDVKIRVTNEVPVGGGSVALTYAGSAPHAIKLK